MIQRFFAASAVAAALAIAPATAQDEEVLATVNGEAITTGDTTFAYESFFSELLQQMPEEQARQQALQILIDLHLLADAAEAEGLDEAEDFARRMELMRLQALRERYMAELVADRITEEDVKARYEEVTEQFPVEEVNARHILVETEEDARDLIARLNEDADFAALAEEHTLDEGTKPRGGSLGFFRRGQMVPAFEEAAFSLEPGAITEEPVQSQYGWHVIKVEDTRTRQAPPLEELRGRIRDVMIRELFGEEMNRLRQEATIERADTGDAAQ
jgi:peptidyl-prolyl cis-trans isomerase C